MATSKCVRNTNDLGSLVLERPSSITGSFRILSSFSGAKSLRRKILDTVSCGTSGFRNQQTQQQQQLTKPPEKKPISNVIRSNGSEKLSVLLRLKEPEDEEIKKKEESLDEFKKVVKLLQCGGKDVLMGAVEVRRLAKDDGEARKTMALLGAIPPLVALLDDSGDVDSLVAALYALLNLGIGNDENKAAIVKAGAVHKMLKLIESPSGDDGGSPNQDLAGAIVANFLGLSALDSNKSIIGSSDAIPFLVRTLKESGSSQAKNDSLRALYNLSLLPSNIAPMLETDLVRILLSMLGDMEVSDRILSVISNVISTPEGRKCISVIPDCFTVLVDVLNWTDSPECQEKATYILMVMAHKSYGDRQAMIEAGVVSSLLELTLLGSTLAQKRASRILEFLRVDKGKQVSETFAFGGGLSSTVSAPLGSTTSLTGVDPNSPMSSKEIAEEEDNMMSDEKKAVKHLVQQSLQNNMRRIVNRANLHQEFVPSDHFKSLTSSSTSKSLPF